MYEKPFEASCRTKSPITGATPAFRFKVLSVCNPQWTQSILPSLVRSTTDPSGTSLNVTESVPAQTREGNARMAMNTARQNFIECHSCTTWFDRQAVLLRVTVCLKLLELFAHAETPSQGPQRIEEGCESS